MSANRHLSPGVDTTLLMTYFCVVTDAVGAMRFPVIFNKFPPTVNLVRSFSFFSGYNFHNIFPYGNFLSVGTCFLEMKITIFVPFTVMIPWANFTSSFAKDRSQIFLCGLLNRFLYYWVTPDI